MPDKIPKDEDRVRMTAYRLTRDGRQSCFRTGIGSDILITAFQLSRYRNAPSTMDFEEILTDWTPVTQQEFDRLALLRLEGSEKITGVYDIDFDRAEFSCVDPQEGWQTFSMDSVSYAVQRTGQYQCLSHEQFRKVLLQNLEGWEVPSPGHFPMRAIAFEGEIGVQADRLVFQIDPESWFASLDAMFGTNTYTAENKDYLTIRARYDAVKGEIGALEVIVNRDDGPLTMPEYVLNCVEKECFRKKMDSYCQQMTGMELAVYGAGICKSQRASRFNIPLTVERLTAYAIERQNGSGRHRHPGAPSWEEQRRFWTDAILQGIARLEGVEPDPAWMEQYDRQLETARGCAATEPLPLNEQSALIRDLSRYVSALETAGGDRRRQIAVVGDLLEDMVTHLSWDYQSNGLSRTIDQVENTLLRMTAQMPMRFTRILLGGERGPCESDFVSGAITDAEAVKATELYGRMSQEHPEVTEWPSICTVYVGRGLDSACGTVDATEFDLAIMREAGDRFLKLPGIRAIGARELKIPAPENIHVLRVEPGAVPEAITIPNTLDALQAAVGGYIEVVGLDANATLVCNEEGELMGLPVNRRMGGDTIAGTFLIVGTDDGDFCSLSDEDAAYYAEQFAQPMPSYGSPEEPTQWEFYVL